MIVSMNQPAYMPWLGYFHRIAVSDLHIVLDHVQFEKNSFVNRNKIRTESGSCWLTVPVKTKGRFGRLPINTLEINNDVNWRRKHWETLQQNYGKAPYFADYAAFFELLYKREWHLLSDLCWELTTYFLTSFHITVPLQYSSEMQPRCTKGDLVLELCKKVGAGTYFSGVLGKDYLDEEVFRGSGVNILYQSYQHPEYSQCRLKTFEPNMAAVDLLFNCGPQSREVLLRGNAFAHGVC